MKNGIVILLLFLSVYSFSQVQIPSSGYVEINFDNFTGTGFSPEPETGMLDSDSWAVTGLSDGDLNFGGTMTEGDYARGIDGDGAGTGGIYSFEVETDNFTLGIQPGSSDFTPGTFTLRLENATGDEMSKMNIEYDIWYLNDQDRSGSYNFSYSLDGNDFIELAGLDFTSPEVADVSPVWQLEERSISIPVSVADGEIIYLRWTSDDVGGGGSRDEFGLDDIRISANDNPTPVELNSFNGEMQGESVVLEWTTATEVNNYGFSVECRVNSAEWKEIGFVDGAGNSNTAKSYSFSDNLDLTRNPNLTLVYRLKQIDIDGKFTYSKEIMVETLNTTSVPDEFSLAQNYPNPFNPTTTIKYSIPVGANNYSPVQLKIYDMLGQEIATLVNEQQTAGNYEVKFDASQLSSGIYLYKLSAGEFSSVKKLSLMK